MHRHELKVSYAAQTCESRSIAARFVAYNDRSRPDLRHMITPSMYPRSFPEPRELPNPSPAGRSATCDRVAIVMPYHVWALGPTSRVCSCIRHTLRQRLVALASSEHANTCHEWRVVSVAVSTCLALEKFARRRVDKGTRFPPAGPSSKTSRCTRADV